MKKVILLLIIPILFLTSCITTKSENMKVIEDMESFKTYMEEASIMYYEKTEKPEEIKKSLNINPGKLLRSYKNQKKWIIKNNRPYKYENEVVQEAIINSLYWYFRTNNFSDDHLFVGTDQNKVYPNENLYFFYSDCYFKKTGNDFFVISCLNKNLVGKKFTGNPEDLKLTVKDDEEVYLLGFFREEYSKTVKVNLDGQDYELPVYYPNFKKGNSILDILPTEKSLYIRIKSFGINKNHKDNSFFEEGLQLIDEKVKNKEFVVIDLRENGGGNLAYVYKLLEAINNKLDNNEDTNAFNEYLDMLFNSDLKELKSSVIAKASYERALEQNQTNSIVQKLLDEYKHQLFLKKKSIMIQEDFKFLPEKIYSGELLNSKIIVLCDYNTASASEILIGFLYKLYGDRVKLIGENTDGCSIYGNPIAYVLPNSKIKVNLTSISARDVPLWKDNEFWKGEGKGFYPDYWCSEKNILDALRYVTKDDELYNRMIQMDY